MENWWDNSYHFIAFSRGNKGFIAINNEDFMIRRNFYTGLPDDVYCDVINCENNHPPCGFCEHPRRQNVIRVKNGWAKIRIWNDADPVVAIHV